MMAFARNSATNALPMLLGLFFKVEGTSSRGIQLLSNASMIISQRTSERIKEQLSNTSIRRAIELMKSGDPFVTVADNINLYQRKSEQRINNRNSMIHATNAAILRINPEGIDVDKAMDLGEKLERRGGRRNARFGDITPDENDDIELEKGYVHLITEIIVKHMPQSRRWKNRTQYLEQIAKEMPRERPIPLEKTETRPFGVFDVNEGSKKGIIELLEAIPERAGFSNDDFSAVVRIIGGDWLTSRNIRHALRDRADDKTTFHRLEHILELSQWFHFALQATQMIIRTHLGNGIEDPTSLSAHKGLLHRVWDPNKPNYAAAKALIRHSLIARIQHAIKYVLKPHICSSLC